jgi:hypothetical protein
VSTLDEDLFWNLPTVRGFECLDVLKAINNPATQREV